VFMTVRTGGLNSREEKASLHGGSFGSQGRTLDVLHFHQYYKPPKDPKIRHETYNMTTLDKTSARVRVRVVSWD
jgi:hypothetical protein